MIARNLLRDVFGSSWLLSIFPALILILLLPPFGSKYEISVNEMGADYSRYVYCDLNSDSTSELITTGKGVPLSFVYVMNNERKVYDQWNIQEDFFPEISDLYFGNFDNDRFSEIYVFSVSNDSLFLNVNEFFEPSGLKLNGLFITKIGIVDGTITSNVQVSGLYDCNNDGFSELYFLINTGFGLEPRYLYYLDIVNKKLVHSNFAGSIFMFPIFFDSDMDGKPEIFGTSIASGNYHVTVPYTDWNSWLKVYNENLEFEFPPVPFPGITTNLATMPFSDRDFHGYLASYNTSSADTTLPEPRIMKYSLKGEKLNEKLYSDLGLEGFVTSFLIKTNSADRIFLFEKELLELNSAFEVINRTKSPFEPFYFSYSDDINDDGVEEFLFYSDKLKKISVYNADLDMLAEADFKASMGKFRLSHSISPGKPNKILITNNDSANILELRRNRSYFLGYIIYPAIYLVMVFFIYIIKRITISQVEQRENLKQRLLTLQLQGIKSQLDPHFTFNSLNSIASLIYLEERQSAYDNLNKFTKLLRVMLHDAERVYRTLNEEIEFLNTYLELEKLRFGDKLSYSIETGEGVTGEEKVPKLVLHTFAENAIKHGIVPGERNGMLKIIIKRDGDYLKIVVEDDGIGRVKSAGNNLSTGKGLKITGEFYDILNQLSKRPIKHSITDLYDASGNPCGTRVEVLVPIE